MGARRQDKNRIVLKKGESQRSDGRYDYRWTSEDGRRHALYAKTLDELRRKEDEIAKDRIEGINPKGREMTVNELFNMWAKLKKGLKDNTYQNYIYMYSTFVKTTKLGRKIVANVKKSDIKSFYITLHDDGNLKINTIESIQNVLHQMFEVAVEDNLLRNNPTSNVLKELKMAYASDYQKRKALTISEEKLFLDYIRENPVYHKWYPIFKVMLSTGCRVGEITGLRWEDVDLKEKEIDINHTLVYYSHGQHKGCAYNIHSPKTKNSIRIVPIDDDTVEAFKEQKRIYEEIGLECNAKIDGYTNFIFLNRFGDTMNCGILNKVIKRIIRDCNLEQLDKTKSDQKNGVTVLPPFSCHTLRHTFTTRLCEAGVNIKVVQDVLGHSDVSTTLNIYADVTKDMQRSAVEILKNFYNSQEVTN